MFSGFYLKIQYNDILFDIPYLQPLIWYLIRLKNCIHKTVNIGIYTGMWMNIS